ncbi:MAG: D-TA family PLP-dependent enzyme [Chitinophagaceae bacterium]|nr:D-TA family PLP-dependent enzyme [Chitinophagaceae bacterium]
MSEKNYSWFTIQDVSTIDTPALLVYPKRVQQNIDAAIKLVGDPSRLRPHIKTHKTKEVTEMLMYSGVHQFKCATIAEAELLGICKAPDVLLAYQPVGPKLKRFLSLIQYYPATKYACLSDNIPAAKEIAAAAKEQNIQITVYIDLNVGMNRTGIAPESATDLIQYCLQESSIQLAGLHAYDGHIRNPDAAERKKICDTAFARTAALHQTIQDQYGINLTIIAGGSPSFPIHAERETVICSPGTFVYWDHGYGSLFPEHPFIPAALVLTRIISLPAPGIICTDLGHKSIAAENPLDKRVMFLNAPELKAVSQSEEHLVLSAPDNHTYQPGDILYGLPIHICPTCALYERAITIIDHQKNGEWMITARDRKIQY